MSLLAECRKCGKKYRFGDDLRGRRVRCQNCGAAILVADESNDPWDDDDYFEDRDPLPRAKKTKRKKSRRKPKKSGNKAAIAITFTSLAVVLVGGGIGFALWWNSRADNEAQANADGPQREDGLPGNPDRDFPSFPHAVTGLPTEAIKGLPFDAGEFYDIPPEAENAAKLYLDAMFEFTTDTEACFSPEEVKKRKPIAERREKLWNRVWPHGSSRPTDPNSADARQAMREFETGFQKLKEAQKRPRCRFQLGTGITALLPHVMTARVIVRALHLRLRNHLAQGKLDDAIDDLEMGLRLTRDVRPGGPQIVQLVSFKTNEMLCTEMMPRVVSDPRLTVGQCDRLLAMFRTHRQSIRSAAVEGFRGECLLLHSVLHDLEHRTGEFTKQRIVEAAAGEKVTPTPGALFSLAFTLDYEEQRERFDAVIGKLTAADYRRLHQAVNQHYTTMLAATNGILYNDAQSKILRAADSLGDQSILLRKFTSTCDVFHRVATIDQARTNGAVCLIAVKRWMLGKRGAPGERFSLDNACRAAGLPEIPPDPHDNNGRPMKYVRRSTYGDTAIYSVGPNLTDEQGRSIWTPNNRRGDIVIGFRRRIW